jgi:hypothetical protein
MSEEGCTGPDCFFEGDRLNSPAAKGVCTDTGGYISNAEIDQIAFLGDNVQTWHDGDSNSDIMVYNGTYPQARCATTDLPLITLRHSVGGIYVPDNKRDQAHSLEGL